MTKVKLHEDCGNSPKNLLLQQMTIAMTAADGQFFHDCTTENLTWKQVGGPFVQGQAQFLESLRGYLQAERVLELSIEHVVNHGKAGAVDGTAKTEHGRIFAFCNVYEFDSVRGAKISAVTSYVIELHDRFPAS
ncbi:MAG: nuclear transport factor 2 family protein [Anaerolineaceae bacterium]